MTRTHLFEQLLNNVSLEISGSSFDDQVVKRYIQCLSGIFVLIGRISEITRQEFESIFVIKYSHKQLLIVS